MTGTNDRFIKYPVPPHTVWLLSILWRRKFSILAVIVLTILLVVCLRYITTNEIVKAITSRPEIDGNITEGKFLGITPHLVSDSGRTTKIDDNEYTERNLINDPDDNVKSNFKDKVEEPYVPKRRIIHFDLKGAPPKVSYLRKLFVLIKELGATGILLEWEDMFPWEDNLKYLAAKNAFNRTEAKEILNMARENKLEVIPLIQTFGHLEFALKNENFVHLREVPESPQALCPLLNSSIDFVKEMIDQVMKLHGNTSTNFFHMGCDEVLNLGECSRCVEKQNNELFLTHVSTVAKYIRAQYSVVPIIWDDMLRKIDLPILLLRSSKIGKLVEPMVWAYTENSFISEYNWLKYQNIFPQAWAASAFKGAFGETNYVPNVERHLDNNMKWLKLMSTQEEGFINGFRGIAITGWQRYDHFATLCELLPAAIPSLAVTLTVVSHGYANNSLIEILYEGLNCSITDNISQYINNYWIPNSWFRDLDEDPFLWSRFYNCNCDFPGNKFYYLLSVWNQCETQINEYLKKTKTKRAWLTDYNIRHNFSVPFRVDELTKYIKNHRYILESVVSLTSTYLLNIFDIYTIAEWIEQKLYPMVIQVEELENASQRLKSYHTWPQRPLPPLLDLQRLGVKVLTNSTSEEDS